MKGRKILLTGGTGSFGKKFVEMTLERRQVERILIYSRDEMKQWEMKNAVQDERVEFILGDVRDGDRSEEQQKARQRARRWERSVGVSDGAWQMVAQYEHG